MSRQAQCQLRLTRRALRDLRGILEYSIEQWGRRVANKYFDELEAGLERLKEHPELLKPEPDFDPGLRFYRVNKHLFACDVQPKSIVVLTVVHARMDIPARLAELQPTLAGEVAILHRKLDKKK